MPYLNGERHPRAKLTAQDVLDIRAEYRPRVVTAKHLAERYGVSEGAIRDILSWRTWVPKGRPARPSKDPRPLLEQEASAASAQGADPSRDRLDAVPGVPRVTRSLGTTQNGPVLCLTEGCDRAARKRGRCDTHYRQWLRKYGHLRCAVDGCMAHQHDTAGKETGSHTRRPSGRRGNQTGQKVWFCRKHERLHLAPSDEIEQLNLSRLAGKIRADAEPGCWTWDGPRNQDGYGEFDPEGSNGTKWLAHRALYVLLVGGHGPGLQLDHRCNQRACVAPFHLRPVTASANSKRRGKAVTDPVEWRTLQLGSVQSFAWQNKLPLPWRI